VSRQYASTEQVDMAGVSQRTLRFNLVHREAISKPVCYSVEELLSTGALDGYKSELAAQIVLDENIPEENLVLGKYYLKTLEAVGECLLGQTASVKLHCDFFEALEKLKSQNRLKIKSKALHSSITKFINEVM
jgi:hypothetical protein